MRAVVELTQILQLAEQLEGHPSLPQELRDAVLKDAVAEFTGRINPPAYRELAAALLTPRPQEASDVRTSAPRAKATAGKGKVVPAEGS